MEKTNLIILVTVKYRDDKEVDFECHDYPSLGEWITLYLKDLQRVFIHRDSVADITCKII